MSLIHAVRDACVFLFDLNFPIGFLFLGILHAIFLIWFYVSSHKEEKILRYFQIADTDENELDHHGEAVTLRIRLRMTHDQIIRRARKILKRRSELLHSKPA